eukprot:2005304-Pyramimonas_sp.AAC.1
MSEYEHRRRLRRITAAPLPNGIAHVAERCGESSARLSDSAPPSRCGNLPGNTWGGGGWAADAGE